MEFFVDYADIDKIKEVAEYFPIDGFTTNPKILTKAHRSVEEMIPEYKKFVEEKNLIVFFQVTADKAEDMLAQAKKLKAYFGNHLIMKIPAVREGYKAVRLCREEGIPTCITVVHSMTQALLAAKAGASYVAPYITHIDNIGADGVKTVSDMVTAFRYGNYPCKVLGASFRTADQIERLAVVGCHAVTITPEMFDTLIAHTSTNESMVGFKEAWRGTFGTRQVDDLLPSKG